MFFFLLWGFFCLLATALALFTTRTPAPKTSGEFYAGIEGLRGILALNVFFHHALITWFFLCTGNWGSTSSRFYAQLGPLSVTMFFFITGFLFWSKRIAGPRLPPGPFLRKRVRRLMPAYLGSVALILAVTAWQTHFTLRVPLHSLLLQIGAWILSGLAGFPRINGFPSDFVNATVTWTLRLEWEFYLLLPFLGWFARRKTAFQILLFCVLLHVGARLLHPVASQEALTSRVKLFAFFMAGCFSVGIAAAHLKARWKQWPLLKHPLCTPLAIVLVLAAVRFLPLVESFGLSLLLAPIFLMVVYGNDFHGLLTSRPILYLGKISYSVYLLHGIVLYVLVQGLAWRLHLVSFNPYAYWALMAVVGGIAILVASASYYLLEAPFLGKSPKKAPPAPAIAIPTPASEPAE